MMNLYFVRTNAYDCVVSDNGDARRVFFNVPYIHGDDQESEAVRFLESVEDDSCWEAYEESFDELLGDGEIIASIHSEYIL